MCSCVSVYCDWSVIIKTPSSFGKLDTIILNLSAVVRIYQPYLEETGYSEEEKLRHNDENYKFCLGRVSTISIGCGKSAFKF